VTVLNTPVFHGQGEGDTVVKVVVLLPRRSDMSREDFERYLRETHVPLLVRLPGLRRLVLNWVLPDPNGPAPAYDAVGEDWFDDAQALNAAFASPEGKAVANDTPNFLDNPMSISVGRSPALGVCRRPRRCPGRGPSGGLRPSLDTACGRLVLAAIGERASPGQDAIGVGSGVAVCWWRLVTAARCRAGS
jgi:uncharacterized protein (TIGR02118 family)